MKRRSYEYVSDVIAKRRRVKGLSVAYRKYLAAYAAMLSRRSSRDDFIHPIEDILEDAPLTPLQLGLDWLHGSGTSVGATKVRGTPVSSNDAVARYLPLSPEAFDAEPDIEQQAHIHDLDMYDGNEDPKSINALKRKRIADEIFYKNTGYSAPYWYHRATGHHDVPKRLRVEGGTNLAQHMEAEVDADGEMDVIADIDWDEDLMNIDFGDLPMNLAQDHNIPNFATGGMKQFSDTKHLSTVSARLGTSQRLFSPLETLMSRFKASRKLSTAWHHHGSSETNKREVFTYVFRHCITMPPEDAVLSPKSATIFKQAPDKETISLKSAEKAVTAPVGSVWYSPYCLKELETISWNINNFKLKPIATGLYHQPADTELPGRVARDDVAGNEDDNLVSGSSVMLSQVSSTPSWFENQQYSPHRTGNTIYAQDSIVRSTGLQHTGLRGAKDHLGNYNVQLGRGDLNFTFVNTGDTTMIVDCVVHRAKESEIFHPFDGPELPANEQPYNPGDIQSEITKPYEVNYMSYHTANQDRKVSDYVREAEDVVVNPEVKFLPTSYRLSKVANPIAPTVASGGELISTSASYGATSTGTQDPVVTNIQEARAPPNFIDIQRKRLIIGPNQRKTLNLVMPAEHYDPTSSYYNGVFNDHGFAVTFGITGKTTKIVVPAGLDVGPAAVARSSQFVGRTAAATSWHIFGHESQTVYPVHLTEKDDYASQINRLADPQLISGQKYTKDGLKLLQEAVYAGPSGRQIDGRYAFLLTDGDPTAEHAEAKKRQRTIVQHIIIGTIDVERFLNFYEPDASGGVSTTLKYNQKLKNFLQPYYGPFYTDASKETIYTVDTLKSVMVSMLQDDINVGELNIPIWTESGVLDRYAKMIRAVDFTAHI